MTTPLPIEIDVQAVAALQNSGEPFLLLDCREQNEHDLVRISGSKLIPMSEITKRIDELEEFRDSRIVVHCHHGGRSLRVTNWLRGQGFSSAQNMSGGIHAWAEQIDSTLARY